MPEDQASREPSQELAAAIAAVAQNPKERARWDRVEELLDSAQQPEAVSELFQNTLGSLSPDLIADVGQRGVRFYETWFGGDSDALIVWLERVRAADPRAQWAFERLTVAYTAAERWNDLLDAYDRAIAGADPVSRRIRLLEEAAQVAKDFASNADRAIGYMLALHALDADNPALAALERLLERRERWDALTELWQSRIASQPPKQALEARIRLANCFLDKLGRAGEALEQIKLALGDAPNHAPAYDLLERVIVAGSANATDRREALGLLKQHKLDLRQPHEVVRVMELGLVQSSDAERKSLLRELVDRLADLGEDTPAMRHQAALLVLDPSPREREALRTLAQRTGDHELLVKSLVLAADQSADHELGAELLLDAGTALQEQLSDPERAGKIFSRVFGSGARTELTVEAGRRLVPLLDKSGREAEMLEVLAKLSEIEHDGRTRRTLLGRMAKLAAMLGFKPRAEQAWQARLQDDAEDIEALEALIDAASEQQQWSRLAALLEQRIRAEAASARRRQDMVWLASTHADRLGDANAAIDVWRRIQHSFGEDPESIAALTDLLGRAERWQELADVLSQAAAHQIARFTELQSRLGDAYRERLDQPELAVQRYASALKVDPRLPAARHGQHALLGDARCRPSAIESLVDAYERSGEWDKTLGLLEDRLSIEPTEVGRAKLLMRAAELHEQHAGDQHAALACLRRAFTLTPDNRSAERDIRRLAERLDSWDAVISTYRETIACFPQPTPRVAELRHDEGRTLEERLRDLRSALAAYAQASSIAPERTDFASAVLRVAGETDDWELAARELVQCSAARAEVVPELIATLEASTAQKGAWEALTRAMTDAIGEQPGIGAQVARELHALCARWHLSQRADEQAAELSLQRAVAADGGDLPSLRALANLQRRAPGKALCETLLAIHELEPNDLDALQEASEVALTSVPSLEKRCEIWQRLFDRASQLMRSGAAASGRSQPLACARWALDQLVEGLGHLEAHERAHGLLLASASLPLAAPLRHQDLHRAARIAARDLKDHGRAIALYRDLLRSDQSDRQVVQELAELYQAGDHLPELLTLKRHDLSLEPEPDAQLALRLQIASLLGELEARGGRMQTLQQNLRARPGHVATLEAISALLSAQSRFADLAELMRSQARQLAGQGDSARASELMRKAAVLYEREQSQQAALESYRELHELEPRGDASAALARLHTAQGAHAQAAKWLELQLSHLPEQGRAGTMIELAQALLHAGEPARAQQFLEQACREEPSRRDARDTLATMYRAQNAWENLAGLLSASAEHEPDRAQCLGLLREASAIYCDTLGTPERALPGLRRAAALAENDREFGGKLGDALLASGHFAEAREVFEGLIKSFGRKRSPERAELHFRLARVAKASGDASHAFEELEQATKMDPAHVPALHMLAALNQEQGDLDRAERAYRGLLMLVRRHQAGQAETIGQSEVFHALSTLAEARGDKAQAEELLESAMEAAMQSDTDASRFQRTLRSQGRVELLMRLLSARLKLATEPKVLAEVLSAQAELQAGMGKRAEALDTLFVAIGMTPDDEALYPQARRLATELGNVDRYLERLESLAEEQSARGDESSRHTAARLLLRIGETVEQELGDLERASGLYSRVESTGLRPFPTWQAIARVAKNRGDLAEERRALQRISELSPDQLNKEQRRACLFGLVELELAKDAWLEAGVQTLERALEDATEYERAKLILRAAVARAPQHTRLAELFEQVARAARDNAMLLEHFERRAGGAGWRELREAIELAFRVDAFDRAEVFLERAAALDEQQLQPAERAWVLSRWAECRKAQGDVRGAVERLRDAALHAEGEHGERMCRELAELAAGPDGDLSIAAAAYTRLLESHPGDASFWQPLLDVYRRLGDRARMEEFAERCLRDLLAPDERSVVHMALARFLLDVARDEEAAIAPLKAALEDKPGDAEATASLTQILERHGRDEELAELLHAQFDRARDEQNLTTIGQLALRMGALYGRRQPQTAIDIYRSALEWLPAERPLIEALLERLGQDGDMRERAELMQSLLKLETGPAAAELALRLAPIWEELYEPDLCQQALELGHRECLEHADVRDRLERFYTERQLWRPLGGLLEQDAERASSRAESVAILKRAAALYRDPVGDLELAGAALRKALAVAPDDLTLLGEVARNLAQSGQHETAMGDVSRLIEAHPSQDPQRAELLRVRAELRLGAEDLRGAIVDLEEAHAIAKEAVASQLIDALERFKTAAFTQGNAEAERGAVMRLVELHENSGDLLAAREALSGWVEQSPDDIEAIRALLRRDQAAGRWSEAAQSCERLLESDAPGARTPATAIELADAWARAGAAERARDWLERIQREHPADAQIRTRLRQLYEETGALGELASLLLTDAKALESTTERVALYQRAAQLFLKAGDARAALPPLGEAAALQPDDNQTQLLMIDLSIQLGTLDDAERTLTAAIATQKRRRSPELACLYQRKARLSAARNDSQEQLKWLNQATDIDRKSSEIASELAEAAIAIRDYEVAMKALRALTMMDDPKPITRALAFLKQAQIASLRGDPRRAQHWARRAKTLDASLKDADALIADLADVED
jgi:tetratricopeptide (TPR) repeat protein